MFVIEHAKEIMYLCFGVGFFGLMMYLIRGIVILTRLLRKIDDVADLVIEYIQKPLSMIVQIHRTFQKIKGFFDK
jgi:hypothetical protein